MALELKPVHFLDCVLSISVLFELCNGEAFHSLSDGVFWEVNFLHLTIWLQNLQGDLIKLTARISDSDMWFNPSSPAM